MQDHEEVIRNIHKSPSGAHIAAIFDFDGTIIAGYSVTAMFKEQFKRGDIGLRELPEMLSTTGQMLTRKIGFSGLMAASAKLIQGEPESTYEELGEHIFEDQIHGLIYPEARAIIEAHREKGHTLAIISSATPYQVEPAARDLGIDEVLCTRFEVKKGKFTGKVIDPVCFGTGKVHAAEQLAAEFDIDLSQSYFYSDSDDDIELLEHVGKPQAMNPNKKLTAIAEKRGWQVRRLQVKKKPGLLTRARSIAATGSLITSFVGGLPILGLTGSKRESVNFSISTFGDVASALIGLKYNVKNENYLYSVRPCVFIFNHQSGADLILIAKLLKRDIASIGKKELADVPLIGRVIQYAGAVLIDRENTQSAISAMQPLVEKIHNENISVCLAPEGTRSNAKSLNHFKKGAFHLAMQAGVPIVPIVIHNSYDALPGDGKVFCPATIDVEVLEPVDTSNWKREDLDRHVAEMEQKYLKTLGYTEIGAKAPSLTKKAATKKAAAKKATTKKTRTKKTRTKKATAQKAVATSSANLKQKNPAPPAQAVQKRQRGVAKLES
ncbi:MAG: HAD-IB family hydrolase [Gammaproteobacteria bacterium]|nr:HAD-IB family hydrolase [Gammaproteobacteria bacterium]NND39347.1 HAD-IB family hydrolase [Pseudomonadales bacterium]NNM10494.1 HAD-IB family hydrolase [Pseudomonadales bacterium]RZV55033.1 MAG: HAD-IB family hydrolase [Pseudomonadales bacterium]